MGSPFDASSRLLLAGGSLLFGIWGLLSPTTLARAMHSTPAEARTIGFRDLGAALVLCTVDGPAPFVVRALYDTGDAIRMRQSRPGVAVGALAFAGLAVIQARRRHGV